MHKPSIKEIVQSSIEVKQSILKDEGLLDEMDGIVSVVTEVFRNGRSVYFCGNGGSASDAQHLAGELSGRFKMERKALSAEALHVNTSFLTAVGNDYGFDHVYERAVEAFCREGDVLICLSTSGNSPNILKAIDKAKSQGVFVLGLSGRSGGAMKNKCDKILCVDSTDTPRIQEAHIMLGHIICELVEANLFNKTQ